MSLSSSKYINLQKVKKKQKMMSPQFFKIILSPHASKLHIPDDFVIKYGADLRDVVFLEPPTGAIWQVKLQNSNGTKWLNNGWNQFKDYYSIACGYFLLFQYNGNSHFSVFIFDLSASEIEYPSGPNENIVGDASHSKNNSKRQKSGIPVSHPSSLPDRVKLEKPDMEEDLYGAADKGNDNCNEVLDPSASNMTNASKCNKRKYPLNFEASGPRYPLRSKQVKLQQSKENGCPSYSGKQRPSTPLSCPGTLSERKETTRMKLDKANSEEDICCAVPKEKSGETNMEKLVKQDRQHNMYDEVHKFKGHCNEVPVVDPSTSKVTTTIQHSKKKTATSLDASSCRYPLRSKQLKEVKIEKGDVEEHCNKIPVVDPSATKMTTTSRHHKKKTSASLGTSHCRYPLRSKLKQPEKLFCAAEKAKGKETNNVEGNLNSLAYKGNDSTASEMRILGKKKMLTPKKHSWDIYFNPHFTIYMQPAYVSRNFLLDIPGSFFKKLIKAEETIVILRVPDGRTWRAKLFDIQSNCPKIESSGWRDFVLGNNLKEHDACVFELTDGFEPVLDVTIFRVTTPVS